tara:strand:+ start:947 stop:2218 length:1272 start_codon:yes stop_codon:yes gene_type:complete
MKTFLRFISEAPDTNKAKEQARKLNLKSDGHGGWLDSKGEFVAKTEGGKLRFYNQRQRSGQDQPQPRGVNTPIATKARPAAAQAQAPAAKPKSAEPEGSDLDKALDTLTVVFGRFNPPTAGHEKLLQQAEKVAAGGDLKIYPSRTVDSKKNPIDPDMKVSYMRKMFPDFEEQIQNDAEMRSIFNVLTTAAEEGYTGINIVVGADRLGEFESLATKYNGDLYNFKEIKTVSAGPRDDDAEGVEGVSSSKQRKAVMDDDYDTFKRGLPKGMDNADGQALFDAVRVGMNKKDDKKKKDVEEEIDLWMVAPKLDPRGLRENYFRKNIFNIGDMVESLNTGLIGKIIRRGTNYLISVTENNVMFKSWTHDLSEYTEKHMERRMRDKTHPNMLVGTGGARKNTQAMVHGQKKIKNFNIKEFINKYKVKK